MLSLATVGLEGAPLRFRLAGAPEGEMRYLKIYRRSGSVIMVKSITNIDWAECWGQGRSKGRQGQPATPPLLCVSGNSKQYYRDAWWKARDIYIFYVAPRHMEWVSVVRQLSGTGRVGWVAWMDR